MDNEVKRCLQELAQASGTNDKLLAAAQLLAVTGMIPNTPSGRYDWMNSRRPGF